MKRDWIIVVLGLVIVVGLGISGYAKLSKKNNPAVATSPTSSGAVAGTTTDQKEFFSEDAKVMFFYSDLCHWCQKEEQEVLPGLGNEGYRVKPMNVGEKPDLWKDYNIEGTPTFIAANGDRLVGFQEAGPLKAFLDAHK